MSAVQEKVDAYFEALPEGRKETCDRLRALIHELHPGITETWKWRAPIFEYKGMVCWVLNFKHHIGINLFKGSLIEDKFDRFDPENIDNKQNRIIKITEDHIVPEDELRYYISEAIRLNEEGISPAPIKKELVIPQELATLLKTHKEARDYFDSLAPSHKREFAHHVAEAKRQETRDRRAEKVIQQLLEQRKPNDQYR